MEAADTSQIISRKGAAIYGAATCLSSRSSANEGGSVSVSSKVINVADIDKKELEEMRSPTSIFKRELFRYSVSRLNY